VMPCHKVPDTTKCALPKSFSVPSPFDPPRSTSKTNGWMKNGVHCGSSLIWRFVPAQTYLSHMNQPETYFIKRAETEQGPLTIAQVNRMKQRREITADTPCRAANESSFRRLDEVLPHLKDRPSADPEKMAKLKQAMVTYEIRALTATAFCTGALFWAPLGIGSMTALTSFCCGAALLFKHRQPIGIVAMLLGGFGLFVRFSHVLSR